HAQSKPHHTILLCNKDDVTAAYELCKKGIFDDYILFWPMTNDVYRLCMSVRHALCGQIMRSSVRFSTQIKKLIDIERGMLQQIAHGEPESQFAEGSLENIEKELNSLLDNVGKPRPKAAFGINTDAMLADKTISNGAQNRSSLSDLGGATLTILIIDD